MRFVYELQSIIRYFNLVLDTAKENNLSLEEFESMLHSNLRLI